MADDAVIPHFHRITDECHSHGTVMCHQIYHVGVPRRSGTTRGRPYWSPSGQVSHHDPWGSHAMSDAEIRELIQAFIDQAVRDKKGGFDGVDLFAGYSCLIDQFWSPLTKPARRCLGRLAGEPAALRDRDREWYPQGLRGRTSSSA